MSKYLALQSVFIAPFLGLLVTALFFVLLLRRGKSVGLPLYALFRVAFIAVLCGLLGGRALVVLRDIPFFLAYPSLSLYFWEGISLSGFLLFAGLALIPASLSHGLSVLAVGDSVLRAARTPCLLLLAGLGPWYFSSRAASICWLLMLLIIWGTAILLGRFQLFHGQLFLGTSLVYWLFCFAFSMFGGFVAEVYLRLTLLQPGFDIFLDRAIFFLLIAASLLPLVLKLRRAA